MDLKQEQVLIERAKSDRAAFALLYDKYYGLMFRYILKRTARIAVAQDITADVFYKALKNISCFEWREIPFRAWLYRIAGNEIANHYNNIKHTRNLVAETVCDIVTQQALANEIEEIEQKLDKQQDLFYLHYALAKLSPKYQEVIALRYFEQRQIHEISMIMGKKDGTIKSLLHRALKKMNLIMTRMQP